MSRDNTSEEWAEAILRPEQQRVEQLERYVSYVRREAYREGLTHHLRAGNQGTPFHTCPFCSADDNVDGLFNHQITCDEVPEHLRGKAL